LPKGAPSTSAPAISQAPVASGFETEVKPRIAGAIARGDSKPNYTGGTAGLVGEKQAVAANNAITDGVSKSLGFELAKIVRGDASAVSSGVRTATSLLSGTESEGMRDNVLKRVDINDIVPSSAAKYNILSSKFSGYDARKSTASLLIDDVGGLSYYLPDDLKKKTFDTEGLKTLAAYAWEQLDDKERKTIGALEFRDPAQEQTYGSVLAFLMAKRIESAKTGTVRSLSELLKDNSTLFQDRKYQQVSPTGVARPAQQGGQNPVGLPEPKAP